MNYSGLIILLLSEIREIKKIKKLLNKEQQERADYIIRCKLNEISKLEKLRGVVRWERMLKKQSNN